MPLEFGAVAKAGSMLGTRALQVFDSSVCRARRRPVDRLLQARVLWQCTPCREGTWWLKQILGRPEHGQGSEADLDKLLDICDNILGRSFCAFG